jgi:hypothetical protein
VKGILRRIARRCDVHDEPSAIRTARLEQELGINPEAVNELLARRIAGDPTALFGDPDMLNCGHEWCRKRREGTT